MNFISKYFKDKKNQKIFNESQKVMPLLERYICGKDYDAILKMSKQGIVVSDLIFTNLLSSACNHYFSDRKYLKTYEFNAKLKDDESTKKIIDFLNNFIKNGRKINIDYFNENALKKDLREFLLSDRELNFRDLSPERQTNKIVFCMLFFNEYLCLDFNFNETDLLLLGDNFYNLSEYITKRKFKMGYWLPNQLNETYNKDAYFKFMEDCLLKTNQKKLDLLAKYTEDSELIYKNTIQKINNLLNNEIDDEVVKEEIQKQYLSIAQKQTINEIGELYQKTKKFKWAAEDEFQINNIYQNRLPQTIEKYLSVPDDYKKTLKNTENLTAENLFDESILNILNFYKNKIKEKDVNFATENLQELSVQSRYLKNALK